MLVLLVRSWRVVMRWGFMVLIMSGRIGLVPGVVVMMFFGGSRRLMMRWVYVAGGIGRRMGVCRLVRRRRVRSWG